MYCIHMYFQIQTIRQTSSISKVAIFWLLISTPICRNLTKQSIQHPSLCIRCTRFSFLQFILRQSIWYRLLVSFSIMIFYPDFLSNFLDYFCRITGFGCSRNQWVFIDVNSIALMVACEYQTCLLILFADLVDLFIVFAYFSNTCWLFVFVECLLLDYLLISLIVFFVSFFLIFF